MRSKMSEDESGEQQRSEGETGVGVGWRPGVRAAGRRRG